MTRQLYGGVSVEAYGSAGAKCLLIQPVDSRGSAETEAEASVIRENVEAPFLLIPVRVASWNDDLSPWPAPPVFGKEGFGDGARETLRKIREEVIPGAKREYDLPDGVKIILGGYSLAGLFALWCGHETGLFHGIAAASPSVWFPGFLAYAAQHPMQAKAVYLSLGDKEERARSPVMRQVGNCIRALNTQYKETPNVVSLLEWNEGNHFRDAALRTAKAFAWTVHALDAEREGDAF